MTAPDYYAVLGVASTASDDAIISAFRQLAKQRHPDRGGTKELMAQLIEARDVLLDADKRRAYDRERADRARRQERPRPRQRQSPPPPQQPEQDPLEAEVNDVLDLYRRGDLEAAVRATERLWAANRSSLLCGRARAVLALQYGFALIERGDADDAEQWLRAANEPIARFHELRDEKELSAMVAQLQELIDTERAEQARVEAEAAAAAEEEARQLELLAREAARQRRRRDMRRLMLAAVWLMASVVTYRSAYEFASSKPAVAQSGRAVTQPLQDTVAHGVAAARALVAGALEREATQEAAVVSRRHAQAATLGAMSEAPTPHYMGRADVVPGLGPFVPGGEVTWPEVVSSVKPRYTSQAMRARISGTVLLDVVVLEDGRPGEITVVRSLDTRFGLDAAAVTAMRQWRFRPGIRDGVPVQTRIRASMQFSLVE